MNNHPVKVQVFLNAPIEKVWSAITRAEEMRNWYFAIEIFKPEPGFDFHFNGYANGDTYIHQCTITEVVENKVLEYSWSYQGFSGKSYVRFELESIDRGVNLTLTHSLIESFDQDNSVFDKTNFQKGWDGIIKTNLKQYLEQTSISV